MFETLNKNTIIISAYSLKMKYLHPSRFGTCQYWKADLCLWLTTSECNIQSGGQDDGSTRVHWPLQGRQPVTRGQCTLWTWAWQSTFDYCDMHETHKSHIVSSHFPLASGWQFCWPGSIVLRPFLCLATFHLEMGLLMVDRRWWWCCIDQLHQTFTTLGWTVLDAIPFAWLSGHFDVHSVALFCFWYDLWRICHALWSFSN